MDLDGFPIFGGADDLYVWFFFFFRISQLLLSSNLC